MQSLIVANVTGGTALVMQTDAASADANVCVSWGGDELETWFTFYMATTAASLTQWHDIGGGALCFGLPAAASCTPDGSNHTGTLTTVTAVSDYDWLIMAAYPDYATVHEVIAADTWALYELHIDTTDNSAELYINSTLELSVGPNGGPLDGTRSLNLGQIMTVPGGDLVYFKDVKAGTTRGASDLFADDFSSGNLSNWDVVTGDCTVVSDPY